MWSCPSNDVLSNPGPWVSPLDDWIIPCPQVCNENQKTWWVSQVVFFFFKHQVIFNTTQCMWDLGAGFCFFDLGHLISQPVAEGWAATSSIISIYSRGYGLPYLSPDFSWQSEHLFASIHPSQIQAGVLSLTHNRQLFKSSWSLGLGGWVIVFLMLIRALF